MAHFDDNTIIVYQAFNHQIADFALENQRFGGPFSLNRMSWIKPNFLWMMFRCGWATKENQERVLAIRISRTGFDQILSHAVHSSFLASAYPDRETWQGLVANGDVRLQWDPDHDPYGSPVERRAIQLGLRRSVLRSFAADWIHSVSDITEYVRALSTYVENRDLEGLNLPSEREYPIMESADMNRLFAS